MNIKDALLQGQFTVIDSAQFASPTSPNPIARAHYNMIRELARMRVPSIPINPEAEDFEETADYLIRLATVWDLMVKDLGEEVRANALSTVDMTQFAGVCFGAVQGYATHEIVGAAEAARQAQNEGDADRQWSERESYL